MFIVEFRVQQWTHFTKGKYETPCCEQKNWRSNLCQRHRPRKTPNFHSCTKSKFARPPIYSPQSQGSSGSLLTRVVFLVNSKIQKTVAKTYMSKQKQATNQDKPSVALSNTRQIYHQTWRTCSTEEWAVSIVAMHVSLARFSTIAQTLNEALLLLPQPRAAAPASLNFFFFDGGGGHAMFAQDSNGECGDTEERTLCKDSRTRFCYSTVASRPPFRNTWSSEEAHTSLEYDNLDMNYWHDQHDQRVMTGWISNVIKKTKDNRGSTFAHWMANGTACTECRGKSKLPFPPRSESRKPGFLSRQSTGSAYYPVSDLRRNSGTSGAADKGDTGKRHCRTG